VNALIALLRGHAGGACSPSLFRLRSIGTPLISLSVLTVPMFHVVDVCFSSLPAVFA